MWRYTSYQTRNPETGGLEMRVIALQLGIEDKSKAIGVIFPNLPASGFSSGEEGGVLQSIKKFPAKTGLLYRSHDQTRS